MKSLRWLLIFFPIALAAELTRGNELIIFAAAALAIIPLAGLLSEATEVLAEKTGPRLGGLLNATLGNATELIITLFAIQAGLLELVRASIIGSIMGHLLLVMGLSILVGGFKNGLQRFDRGHVGLDATLAILAVIALSVPSLFNLTIEPDIHRVEGLSLTVAVAMLIIYLLSIVYSVRSKQAEATMVCPSRQLPRVGSRWSTRTTLSVLTLATIAIALMSEFLVGAVEPVTQALGFGEFFVGIIIVPIIGNVAEHTVALQMAMKDQMDLSLSIALGSSLQIALFVAPVLVFISLLMGHPLTLEFNSYEMISLTAAAVIAAFVSLDGESNWFEGAMLLVVYAIVALAFFFLPIKL